MILRVFVVDWARPLPRRREDTKNRQSPQLRTRAFNNLLPVHPEGKERKIITVESVPQIENPRETGSGEFPFVPIAVKVLPFQQIIDAALDLRTGGIPSGYEPHYSPGGL